MAQGAEVRVPRCLTWRELAAAAPELARLGRSRLEAPRVALLATLRPDGSPRVSPVEPFLTAGELVFGSMARSQKTRDLARDPRCVLHSIVTAPDAGEPELKLHGRARAADPALRKGCREGWWHGRPAELATVFALAVEEAVLVEWDLEGGWMTVRRWSAERGPTEARRRYP
jgi:pyridoxamine 5'-phosphate oxidase-like protein